MSTTQQEQTRAAAPQEYLLEMRGITKAFAGEQEFMGLPFCVNEHVLIPRQDTEVLVEEAIRVIQKEMPEAAVLDLCTGSGCIGISIQSFCSNTQVTAADLTRSYHSCH